METTLVTNQVRNYASIIHLSVLSKYFIPFGNYFIPIIMWATRKETSEFTDYNGKQVINFQLSMFLYSLILIIIAVPAFLFSLFSNVSFNQFTNGDFIFDKLSTGNLTGIVLIAVIASGIYIFSKIIEFFLIIYGAIKTSEGEYFKYPLTINFIK